MVISFWTDRRAMAAPHRFVHPDERRRPPGFPDIMREEFHDDAENARPQDALRWHFRRTGLNPAGKTPFLRIDTARLGAGDPSAGVTNVMGIVWTR